MSYLIVIPTYNEKENISKLIPEIFNLYKNIDFSIAVVDDNSYDGTKEELYKLQAKYSKLLLLERKKKFGLASAYIDGFKLGLAHGFDKFIEMDADFSHNPKYLKVMFEKLEKYDLVIGSRNIKGGKVVGWSKLRNFISKGGSLFSKIILFSPINDLTGGFNGWTKETLNKIGLDTIISKGYSFQIEMKYKAIKNNAKYIEFPIVFEDRKFGDSKMNGLIFAEALLNVFKIRFMNKH